MLLERVIERGGPILRSKEQTENRQKIKKKMQMEKEIHERKKKYESKHTTITQHCHNMFNFNIFQHQKGSTKQLSEIF